MDIKGARIRRKHQRGSFLTPICASAGNSLKKLPMNYVHKNKTGAFDLNETLITPTEAVHCCMQRS